MATVLKLGFKDSPTIGTDDAIDLISAGSTTGYFLKSGMSYGSPKLDTGINRLTRALTIPLEVRGSTIDDANSKLRELYRYVEQTEQYFNRFGGNIPARSDGAWHQGNAAVLTEQPSGASYMVYWNVLGGDVVVSGPLEDVTVANKAYQVTLTLICEAAARGNRVELNNIVSSGDFAPPFAIGTTYYQDGWSFPSGTWTVSSTYAKYGAYSLKWTGAAGGSATSVTTTLTTVEYQQTPYCLLSIWARGSITSGTCTVSLDTDSGAGMTSRASVTFTSADNTNMAAGWVQKYAAYQLVGGDASVRLSITAPTNGTLYFDGAAIWRTTTVISTPPSEYATGGSTTGIPTFSVYNAQGDTSAPVRLRVEDRVTPTANKVFVIGGRPYDSAVDKPLYGLDLAFADGSTSSSMFFGKIGPFSSGAATSSTYQASGAPALHSFDLRPRLYRAFMVYAANNNAAITAAKITIPLGSPGSISKTFTQSIPQTYASNANAAATDYRVWELGDFWFGLPGTADMELDPSGFSPGVTVTLTHSNNANRYTSVAGVVLVPAEQYAAANINTNIAYAIMQLSTETSAPKAAVGALNATVAVPTDLNNYDPLATLNGGNLYLKPGNEPTGTATFSDCMRYEVLQLKAVDSTYSQLYTFDASIPGRAWLSYSPRYVLGVR